MQKVQSLNKYKNSESPVLSVYLGNSEKKSPSVKTLLSQFHSLIHEKLNREEQDKFRLDISKIEAYLEELFDSRGKRSVVFFSAGKGLFEVLDFEFFLPTFCVISNATYLKPINKAFGIHDRYLVLLADRKRARLFTVHLGEIEEHEDVFGEFVPQKVRQINKAWMREDKILRHIEDHLHRHLSLIAQKTAEFIRNKNIHFVVIGGHREFFSKIKKLLPPFLSRKVLGEFVTELNIPLNVVFLQSKKIAANASSRNEQPA